MQKVIEFEEGRSYNCKASALSPIVYNKLFPGRDFMKDMRELAEKSAEKTDEKDFTIDDYEYFVNIAYLFVYQGLSPSPKQTQEQKDFLEKYPNPWYWIDTFETFSIYENLDKIVELWVANEDRISSAKNPVPAPPGK